MNKSVFNSDMAVYIIAGHIPAHQLIKINEEYANSMKLKCNYVTCGYPGTDNILKYYFCCPNLSNLLAINTNHISISKPEAAAIMRRSRDIDGIKTTLI